MRAILTPEDLMERKIEPGWYPAEIFDYKEEVTKGSEAKPSDGSMNAIFHFRVTDPSKPDAKPRELRRYFNEKAFGMGRNLWAVLGWYTKGSKTPLELTSDLFKSAIGHKMLVYIKKNAAGYDNIEDYRPIPTT